MIRKLALAASLGFVATSSANGQPYGPIKAPGSGKWDLGWELEQRFAAYIATCGISVPLKMIKPSFFSRHEKPVSAIDSNLIGEMRLNAGHAIEQPLGVGLGRYFGYIFTDAEKTNPQWQQNNFLSIRYDDDKGVITAFGFPEKHYSASCASVLGTALKVGGEYSFSIATLKAAFEADYKSENHSSIELSTGVFESPIWAMWKPGAVADAQRSRRKFFVAMLFWDWYSSTEPSGNYYLLTTLRGTSYHRQFTANTEGKIKASVEAGGGIPFLTASGKVNGSTDSDRKLEVRDFEVFVDAQSVGRPAVRQWQPVPNLDEVLATIKDFANVSTPVLADPSPITSNQTRNFTIDIDGLPTAYCEAPSWDVRDSATATTPSTTLTMVSATRVPDATTCRFAFSYTAGAIQTGGDVVLSPALTSKVAFQSKRAIVPLKRVTIATTPNPSMSLLIGDPRAKVSKSVGTNPTQYDLVWTIDLKLIDNGKFGDAARIVTSQLGLNCPPNTLTLGDAQLDPSIVGAAGANVRTLRLTAKARFLGGDIDANYAFESCTLGGSIIFLPLDGGPTLERTVPANILLYYPKRVPAP